MKAYRILAYIIAVEVVIQAAAIAFALSGLGYWVSEEGGVLNKAAMDSDDLEFTGIVGFMVHGMNGMMLIPLLALVLLIVSFFAKVPGGVKAAAIVFGLVILQVVLGISSHSSPYLAPLHAINAFGILAMAVLAGKRAGAAAPAAAPAGV